MTKHSLVEKYFKGQTELGIPNHLVLNESFDWLNTKAVSQKATVAVAPKVKIEEKTAVKKEILQPVSAHTEEKITYKPQEESFEPSLKAAEQIALYQSDNRRDLLVELYNKHKNCAACSLCKTRKKFVFGAGTAYTDVLVIGEAPGEQEDIEGKPFVGAAGQLLTKMLAAINLERDKIFIANILKCRPPGNRKPNSSEIATCFGILRKQIEIISPKAILLLGGTAANAILQTISEKSVGSMRGIVHYYEGIPVIVSYHPSALLRDASWKKPAWDDLQKFERLLKEIRNVG
ncbi:MAG: uracil-DNA glycosylase [Chitinivibrionia bacterium]|nr:uracil-DNA glycosylase [Chitinivibrionia bacterium]